MRSPFRHGGLLAALGVGALSSVPGALANPAGDPAAGQDLARAVCAECHQVERVWIDDFGAGAPPFTAIAESEHSETSLKVFLRTPHVTMPNLILTPTEIEDLVAYIMTMRPIYD